MVFCGKQSAESVNPLLDNKLKINKLKNKLKKNKSSNNPNNLVEYSI